MDVQSVYPGVAKIIADVLVVDESDVALDKRLIADLGAESIDFLDLIFQLEKEFKIKIPRGQIEKEARGSLSDAEFEQGGVLTDQGVATLKNYLSEISEENFKANMKVNEIPMLFTVETMCKLVVSAKAKKEAEATA